MGNFEVTIFHTKKPYIENELFYVHHFVILLNVSLNKYQILACETCHSFLKRQVNINIRYHKVSQTKSEEERD